ncbi:unnamed protein product [Nippostrongylus brasiliensis]|uniref:G_PROTEIN_RECEP_F1_2 domain-containing protein n=1 Tax=Nippostrongylus brasiliensis TaxID=27835 RepID=A0A0N4YHU0_NIPBR|nr:unnamed protein product [Nippostrongylus brasiliensis]
MDMFLVTDMTVLTLLTLDIILNGIVLFTYFRNKQAVNSLRIVVFLSFTDFLHAVAILPYSVYLVVEWNDVEINMDPYKVLLLSLPLLVHMKVNFTLTVFIAFDRVVALYYPLQYRSLPQMTTAKVALAVGTVIGAVDVMLELIMTVPTHVRGCGALGCFVNPQFGKYWGYSNMALGFVVILLTIVILVKLRKLRKKSNHGTNRNLSFLYTQDISWMVNKWGQILHYLWLLKLRKRRRSSTLERKEAHG